MTPDLLLARWTEAGDKMVALAEALPGDRLEHRPAPDARSAAEVLRHAAFWNRWLAGTLRGEEVDGEANELPRDACPDRASLLAALRQSFDAVAAEIRERDGAAAAAVVPMLEHNAEHYGQLAAYARLSGVVPPASRG